MSSPKEEKKGRVEVGDLPHKEEELKDSDAENIKGGGVNGSSGSGGEFIVDNEVDRSGSAGGIQT